MADRTATIAKEKVSVVVIKQVSKLAKQIKRASAVYEEDILDRVLFKSSCENQLQVLISTNSSKGVGDVFTLQREAEHLGSARRVRLHRGDDPGPQALTRGLDLPKRDVQLELGKEHFELWTRSVFFQLSKFKKVMQVEDRITPGSEDAGEGEDLAIGKANAVKRARLIRSLGVNDLLGSQRGMDKLVDTWFKDFAKRTESDSTLVKLDKMIGTYQGWVSRLGVRESGNLAQFTDKLERIRKVEIRPRIQSFREGRVENAGIEEDLTKTAPVPVEEEPRTEDIKAKIERNRLEALKRLEMKRQDVNFSQQETQKVSDDTSQQNLNSQFDEEDSLV